MKKYIVGLDLGTTGNRAVVFDRHQRIVCKAYEEFPQHYPKAGWVEHDAIQIRQSTLRVLKKALNIVGANNIECIGITNQRETVVFLDSVTGQPIRKAIVWQDRRTASMCAKLSQKSNAGMVHKKTGLLIDPYFSATKIRWALEHDTHCSVLAKQGRLRCGTVDSWISWCLSGGKKWITDTSNSSRTLLFDIHRKCWSRELSDFFSVPLGCMPEVVPTSAQEHFVTDKKVVGASIPVSAIVGDQQAAAFAQGCYDRSTIKNTYGTGLFAMQGIGSKPILSKDLLTTVAWSLGDIHNTSYAFEGSVFIGASAIQWLRDGLGLIARAEDTQKICRNTPDSGGVYFVPALAGLGSPYWDPNARGLFIGMTRATKASHMIRAVVESIAFCSRDILDNMQKNSSRKMSCLWVDGGASANDFLMQFQADLLNVPIKRPYIIESTALGAAALAAIQRRYWPSTQSYMRARKLSRVFKPSQSRHRELSGQYGRWKEAVKRSLGWYNSN